MLDRIISVGIIFIVILINIVSYIFTTLIVQEMNTCTISLLEQDLQEPLKIYEALPLSFFQGLIKRILP